MEAERGGVATGKRMKPVAPLHLLQGAIPGEIEIASDHAVWEGLASSHSQQVEHPAADFWYVLPFGRVVWLPALFRSMRDVESDTKRAFNATRVQHVTQVVVGWVTASYQDVQLALKHIPCPHLIERPELGRHGDALHRVALFERKVEPSGVEAPERFSIDRRDQDSIE